MRYNGYHVTSYGRYISTFFFRLFTLDGMVVLVQMVAKISDETLQRGDPSCLKGVDDMVKMDILTVGSVLHNLRSVRSCCRHVQYHVI